ncbi:PAS domain S-box protein [Trichlorobacter lovleyi]|uniref:ATP-binding protein n=1 Tax=Trichlorobacter lovleyi TaxID=313985 RepID=UPI00224062F0|nr:ATP-binding protein [Trichlorobacter lovleyi]QOX78774.1 PAS domain S-box protein [Trichlorobacter lovleyi]
MKQLSALSIRAQLVLITLIIALPAIVIIIYVGVQQRNNVVDDAYQLTRLLSERIASEQKYTAAAAEQLLVTLAQMPEVRQHNQARVKQLLLKLNELNPQYANILVTDLSGKTWAAVFMPPPPAMLDDRRYFKNAISSGRLSSGEYVVSKSMANKPVFHFAYPYRDTAGKIGGVIVVAFRLDTYSTILKNSPLPEGTNFLLLDHAGVIMHRALEPEKVIGRKYPEVAFKKMLAGPDEDSYRGPASLGDERFISYRKIRLQGESEPYMYVRVGVPVKTTLAAADQTMLKNIAFLVAFLCGAFLLAYLIGKRSIADRIILLEQASQRLAGGEMQTQVASAVSGGEIGRLAQSFDTMAQQLTEREQVIRESEARLRSITDSAQDAILMMDAQGAITFWNPAAEQILGYHADEALGKDLHAFLAPSRYMQAYHDALPGFVRSGEGTVIGKTIELAARRKDGQEIMVSLALSSVLLHGAWHAVGILRDITEIKHYQEELLEARHSAEAANRAKSEFLANMSHEIRTPMNGVVGMAQLLRYTQPTREQEEYLDNLELSCKNLLELINDILDLSKIESGKLELESAVFSLRSCIQEVISNQASRIEQKGLQLLNAIDDQVPEQVVGDSLRFKQILLNLLGNAIKFTEAGSITISGTLSARQETGCTFRLVVNDTGIGMTGETLQRIFNSFEQADSSTTRIYGGSGLGLTICRRLTELMGGRIWAESVFGTGSTFFLELPFTLPQADGDGTGQAVLPAEPVQTGMDRRLKILVAEDNKLNADTIVAMLKRMGHESLAVSNGREALEKWHASAFNCILMDIQMPVMDGNLAVATIRKQEQKMGGHTPIIAMTAHALHGDRERFLAEGFDGYVSKPVAMQALAAELRRVSSA